MSFFDGLLSMLGRWLLGWFFISEALHRIADWDAMVILVQMKHVPYGQPLLALGVVAMIFGGSMLFIGFQTRFSALILALCTIAWTGLAHDFWTIRNAAERASDYQDFALGIAVIGGLLTIAAFGGGRFSFRGNEE
jgi:putative oxidoreductase